MIDRKLLTALISEWMGTFLIVFTGCGAAMVAERFPGSFGPGGVALVFGLIVTCVIYGQAHLSGAHFNPAVTLALVSVRKFSTRLMLPYLLMQFAGAASASWLLSMLLPLGVGYGITTPAASVTTTQAFLWEVLITFILMWTALGSGDSRGAKGFGGVSVGAIVAVCAFVAGPVTGASMNPARSFGPALLDPRGMETLWLYLLAPSLGAVGAAQLYELLLEEPVASTQPSRTTEGQLLPAINEAALE